VVDVLAGLGLKMSDPDRLASGPADGALGQVHAALQAFDRCFVAGDADGLTDLFAADAQMLLLHSAPIVGRESIRGPWRRTFARFDTSAWRTDPLIVEVHGDRAYVLAVYTETLVPYADDPSQSISGRLVQFMRRDPDGAWRFSLVLNSHVRPVE
jgi:uncharacterized protein (TIGR02246 family)